MENPLILRVLWIRRAGNDPVFSLTKAHGAVGRSEKCY